MIKLWDPTGSKEMRTLIPKEMKNAAAGKPTRQKFRLAKPIFYRRATQRILQALFKEPEVQYLRPVFDAYVEEPTGRRLKWKS